MSAPTAGRDPGPTLVDPAAGLPSVVADETPPEEKFWRDYNSSYELPISSAVSVLFHTLIVALFAYVFLVAMNWGPDKKPVGIESIGGEDEFGRGSPGSGGQPEPLHPGYSSPTQADLARLADPSLLPDVKKDIAERIKLEDPNAAITIPDETAAALAQLDQTLRDKMLGVQKGQGKGDGSGPTGQAGTGVGGFGADKTRARSMRWILRFNTRTGRDYLDQLQALGAIVLVPVPPQNKEMYIFRDLANPKPGAVATSGEISQLDEQIRFSDLRADSVKAVTEALGCTFGQVPPAFWAFFPKRLEEELASKEIAYQNKRPEQIDETIFTVIVVGGKYQIRVADQKLKR